MVNKTTVHQGLYCQQQQVVFRLVLLLKLPGEATTLIDLIGFGFNLKPVGYSTNKVNKVYKYQGYFWKAFKKPVHTTFIVQLYLYFVVTNAILSCNTVTFCVP